MPPMIDRDEVLHVARLARLRLAEVLEASPDMVVMSDAGGRITFVNHAACRLLGRSHQELLGTEWSGTYAAPLSAQRREEVLTNAIQNGSWQGKVTIAAPNGAAVATSQVVTAHKDTNGTTRFFSMISRDVADTGSFQARIHQLVNYDSLTGLPNLAYMGDLVPRLLGRTRDSGGLIALVWLPETVAEPDTNAYADCNSYSGNYADADTHPNSHTDAYSNADA